MNGFVFPGAKLDKGMTTAAAMNLLVYCAGMPFALPPKEYFDEWFEENGVNLGDDSAKLSFLVDFLELAGLPASHAHWPWWLHLHAVKTRQLHPLNLKTDYLTCSQAKFVV